MLYKDIDFDIEVWKAAKPKKERTKRYTMEYDSILKGHAIINEAFVQAKKLCEEFGFEDYLVEGMDEYYIHLQFYRMETDDEYHLRLLKSAYRVYMNQYEKRMNKFFDENYEGV